MAFILKELGFVGAEQRGKEMWKERAQLTQTSNSLGTEFCGDSGKQGGVCVEERVLSLQILFDFFILM